MNILQINSSAKRIGSSSTRLAEAIVGRLVAVHPDADLTVRDLVDDPVTPLDQLAVQARFLRPDARTEAQATRMAKDDQTVAQFMAADIIVLGTPMYNFNIPAQLQHWIDAVVRPGVSFQYTEKGPVGLAGGRTVYLALSSGGAHRGGPSDMPARYLTYMMGFLGISDVRPVYAENQSRGEDMVVEAFAKANSEIMAIVS